jgi:DNA-binding beta-propeller fold protein YncE
MSSEPQAITFSLSTPIDVAIINNEIFIADEMGNSIQVYSLDGQFKRALSISHPTSLESGPDHLLYATEGTEHKIVAINPSSGVITKSFGSFRRIPGNGFFFHPTALAVSPQFIWASDDSGWIQQFSLSGRFIRRFGHPFLQKMHGSLNDIGFPQALAADKNNNLYVADSSRQRVIIFNSKGQGLRAYGPQIAGSNLDAPSGLAFMNNTLFVSDAYRKDVSRSGKERIVSFSSRNGGSQSQWGKVCGFCTLGSGSSEDGGFAHPQGIAIDNGRVYVADRDNHRVQVFDTQGHLLLIIR